MFLQITHINRTLSLHKYSSEKVFSVVVLKEEKKIGENTTIEPTLYAFEKKKKNIKRKSDQTKIKFSLQFALSGINFLSSITFFFLAAEEKYGNLIFFPHKELLFLLFYLGA